MFSAIWIALIKFLIFCSLHVFCRQGVHPEARSSEDGDCFLAELRK